jgi:uncharacterized protein
MTTDLIKRIEDYFLLGRLDEQLWAPDVVVEAPFAPPGQPRRFEGATTFLDATRASRESMRQAVRFEEFRVTAEHQTTDPEVTVLEYELGGTVLTTGRRASAPFVAVMRVRAGRIVHWREYQDKLAIADALSHP